MTKFEIYSYKLLFFVAFIIGLPFVFVAYILDLIKTIIIIIGTIPMSIVNKMIKKEIDELKQNKKVE